MFQLNASAVNLNNGRVKIINENLDTSEIFNLSKIVIGTDDLSIKGPAVNIAITKLSLLSKRGFEIKSLKSDFSYNPNSIKLNSLNLESKESLLKGDFLFNFKKGEISDFLNKANLNFKFTETKINTNDLNTFFNEFGKNQMSQFAQTCRDYDLEDLFFAALKMKPKTIII